MVRYKVLQGSISDPIMFPARNTNELTVKGTFPLQIIKLWSYKIKHTCKQISIHISLFNFLENFATCQLPISQNIFLHLAKLLEASQLIKWRWQSPRNKWEELTSLALKCAFGPDPSFPVFLIWHWKTTCSLHHHRPMLRVCKNH